MLRMLVLYTGNKTAVKSHLQTIHVSQGRGCSEPVDQGWAITFLSGRVTVNRLSYWARASKSTSRGYMYCFIARLYMDFAQVKFTNV